MIRNDWTKEEIRELYDSPLLELIYQAATMKRKYHDPREVQLCTLLNIKTGGCSEDCSYCPQSSRYQKAAGLKAERLMGFEDVLEVAKRAKAAGSTRFCMGAAWRQVRDSGDFEKVLDMVREVRKLGMEVCVTLGMLTPSQVARLKEAGLHSYNHNLDTSREHYPNIITTRTYDERLETLGHVRDAGLFVCCGGIMGLGETDEDRISFLHTLATLPKHPQSVPINALVAIKGTPLADQKPVSIWVMVRMVALARVLMPQAMVRLSAGRFHFSAVEQALLFLAGANSIHTGEKLLTTPNCNYKDDRELLDLLGLFGREPFKEQGEGVVDAGELISSDTVGRH